MNKAIWGFGLGLAVLVFGGVSAQESEPIPSTTQQKAMTFTAPYVAVTLMSDAEDLVFLRDVDERVLGERRFLTGQGTDDHRQADWRDGRRVWVGIDDIQQVVEFDSVDDFTKSYDVRQGDTDAHAASVRRSTSGRVVRQ